MTTAAIQSRFAELMQKHYQIRCVCTVCGRKQVRKVADICNGARCYVGGLSAPRCEGELNYYTDDFNDSVTNCMAILGYINTAMFMDRHDKLAELLDTVLDDIGNWAEHGASPSDMGWVGQDGRP